MFEKVLQIGNEWHSHLTVYRVTPEGWRVRFYPYWGPFWYGLGVTFTTGRYWSTLFLGWRKA